MKNKLIPYLQYCSFCNNKTKKQITYPIKGCNCIIKCYCSKKAREHKSHKYDAVQYTCNKCNIVTTKFISTAMPGKINYTLFGGNDINVMILVTETGVFIYKFGNELNMIINSNSLSESFKLLKSSIKQLKENYLFI